LALYNFQKATDVVQEQLLNTTNRPKISLFGQGGYAMPGLNGFDVNPEWYYIGGIRLIWPLGGYYTQKNQKQILRLDQQTIDVQKDVFLFNTHLTLRQQSTDIVKLQQMINKDTEIISKLTEVKNSARAQLENGIVTTFEYIGDLDAEEQARQNLLVHRVQLLLDEYNYRNTSGN
jgi:outer membrane protein TolC